MTGYTLFPRKPTHRGFTLIELLVVIAIIAILAALAFPASRSFIEKGNQAKCTANLRQIGSGMQEFVAEKNGFYPYAGTSEDNSWARRLQPYTGSLSRPSAALKKNKHKHCYYCPSSEVSHAISDYAVNINVILQGDTNQLSAVSVARPSQTILALDAGRLLTAPDTYVGTWRLQRAWLNNPPADPWSREGPKPRHGNQLNALFCDGSVQTISYEQLLELHRANAFEIK
jgi:prepilin-type N-terminal cleavage/methylation domain-containing protein/prepilin-type processing-associated H-X9-DG protein